MPSGFRAAIAQVRRQRSEICSTSQTEHQSGCLYMCLSSDMMQRARQGYDQPHDTGCADQWEAAVYSGPAPSLYGAVLEVSSIVAGRLLSLAGHLTRSR